MSNLGQGFWQTIQNIYAVLIGALIDNGDGTYTMRSNLTVESVDISAVTLKDGDGATLANVGANGLEVDVKALPALAAGTNNIGDVDVASLPALPAGDHNIGNVDIASLPDGQLGQQAKEDSISTVPASDIPDATYVGDIKFGESLPAGTNAIGKLAANSGVDIGDVDVTSLPAGNLGQQLAAASLSTAPATDIADATYVGDIKFGEALPAGDNNIGNVDLASAIPAGTNYMGKTRRTDGTTDERFPTATFAVAGASPLTILASAGEGLKNRVFEMVLGSDIDTLVALSDGMGSVYLKGGQSIPFPWGIIGRAQGTAATAITATAAGATLTAIGSYATE